MADTSLLSDHGRPAHSNEEPADGTGIPEEARHYLHHKKQAAKGAFCNAPGQIILVFCALVSAGWMVALIVKSPLLLRDATGGHRCIDGTFLPQDLHSTYRASLLFVINLGAGSLSFTAAKTIDIVFDLIVGRGGQAVLTYVCYRVFTRTLCFSMEKRPASYELYSSVTLAPVSMSTLGAIIKDYFRYRRRDFRTTFTTIGLTLAGVYVVAFPTLISAATGYSATSEPAVVHDNGTIVDIAFQQKRNAWYSSSNGLEIYYNNTYLATHGICQPRETYRWGCSLLLTCIIAFFTVCWMVIIWALSADAHRHSWLAWHDRRVGPYRAVLDLSKAIREDLGEEAQLLSNRELEMQLKAAHAGIRFSFLQQEPEDEDLEPYSDEPAEPRGRSSR